MQSVFVRYSGFTLTSENSEIATTLQGCVTLVVGVQEEWRQEREKSISKD